MLNAIVEALRPNIGFVNIDILRNSSQFPAFRDKLDNIEAFFAESRLERNRLQWLLVYSIRSMANGMRKHAIVDCNYVMANIHKLTAHVDRSFPGYGKAGLLSLICKHGRGWSK